MIALDISINFPFEPLDHTQMMMTNDTTAKNA